MFDGIDIVIIRVWDSIRIDRISSKFTHLERVRTEFSASKFEYSQESNRKPTEIDRNSPNSDGTEFFPKLNPKTLVLHGAQGLPGARAEVQERPHHRRSGAAGHGRGQQQARPGRGGCARARDWATEQFDYASWISAPLLSPAAATSSTKGVVGLSFRASHR